MFRNRGIAPNITINNANNNQNNNNNSNNNGGFYHHHFGYYYIINYDKNFLLMEIIATLFVVIIGLIVYLWFTKYDFFDPIAAEKQNFLTFQLVTTTISMILTGAVTFLAKSKEQLIKIIRVIGVISFCIIILTIVMKNDMNKKYTEQTFNEFYEKYEKQNEKDENEQKVTIGLTGIKLTNPKENYIEKSKAAYRNFNLKSNVYIGMYAILTMFIFYLSARISHIEEKKEKATQNDEIIFDEDIHYK